MAYIDICVISQHFMKKGVWVNKKDVDNTFFVLETYEWCQIKAENLGKISGERNLSLTHF